MTPRLKSTSQVTSLCLVFRILLIGALRLMSKAYMGRLIANPQFDWTFLSVPQKHANDRVVLQPCGKGLGGSSLVRASCDRIDRAVSNCSSAELLRYFQTFQGRA